MGKETELISAIKQEDVALIQKILTKNCSKKSSLKRFNINHQDNDGMSPFHQAILTGNVIIIKLLLDYGSAIDSRDIKGMRPLHYASWQGKDLPIKVLLRVGSSVNEQALDGNTPLHFASEHGHVSAVNMLLQHDADVTIRNKQYKTPLDLACEFGRIKVVEMLLNNERSIDLLRASSSDIVDNEHTTCLHLASRNGHVEVISLLLEHGMDINRQTLQGTCLHEAAKFGKTEVVRLLLSHGIDASRLNSYEQTALEIVNKFTPNKGAKELKQLLKEASTDLIAQAVHDYTNVYDPTQLSFKEGDQIVVIERSSRGAMWKGYIRNVENQESRVGYFPANAVFILNKSNNISEDIMQKSQFSSHSLQSNSSLQPSPDSSKSSSSHRYSYHSAGSSGGSSGNGRNSFIEAEEMSHNFGNFPDLISQGLKEHEIVCRWLTSIHLEKLSPFFENAGYDLPSIAKMTPEDLNAIGITQPEMRNRLKNEIRKINIPDGIPDYKPNDLTEWLRLLKMPEYIGLLNRQGYRDLQSIKNLSWEDYEDIGIKKLGHQKKFTLAIERLKKLEEGIQQRHSLSPTEQSLLRGSISTEAFNRPAMELPTQRFFNRQDDSSIFKSNVVNPVVENDVSQISSELKNMQMPLFSFSYSTLPRSGDSRRLITSSKGSDVSLQNNYDYIYPHNVDRRSFDGISLSNSKKEPPPPPLRTNSFKPEVMGVCRINGGINSYGSTNGDHYNVPTNHNHLPQQLYNDYRESDTHFDGNITNYNGVIASYAEENLAQKYGAGCDTYDNICIFEERSEQLLGDNDHETANNYLDGRKSVSTLSLASNASGGTVESNTLPFANENVGTIKQKAGINANVNAGNNFNDNQIKTNGIYNSNDYQHPGKQNNCDITSTTTSLFNDIDGMLLDLSHELDEMLKMN